LVEDHQPGRNQPSRGICGPRNRGSVISFRIFHLSIPIVIL